MLTKLGEHTYVYLDEIIGVTKDIAFGGTQVLLASGHTVGTSKSIDEIVKMIEERDIARNSMFGMLMEGNNGSVQ